MNKTLVQSVSSAEANKPLQKSATLNRKYVKRPIISVQSVTIEREAKAVNLSELAETVEQADLRAFRPTITVPVNKSVEVEDVPIPAQEEKPLKKITIEKIETSTEPEQSVEPEKVEEPSIVAGAFESPDQPAAPNPFQAALDRAASIEEAPKKSPSELKNEAIKRALKVMEEQKENQAIAKVIREDAREENLKAAKARSIKARLSRTRKQTKSIVEPAKSAKKVTISKMPKMAKSGSVISNVAKNSAKESMSQTFKRKKYHSGSKFFLAFTASAACVAVLAYFVNLNMPTISVRVAAMQTGIEASYPSYVPRDFSLGAVTSDKDGTVSIAFHGATEEQSFVLSEEKSSWDSNALLNNYVKPSWGEKYDTLREQGITIYISNSNAAWVNGGILYKISSDSANLNKKQIKNIVTSL